MMPIVGIALAYWCDHIYIYIYLCMYCVDMILLAFSKVYTHVEIHTYLNYMNTDYVAPGLAHE